MKKQKSIKLAVPKPCTENWNNMSPNGKGRHCSSCEKTVIDFSQLSDSEIYKVLAENNSKVCGKFSAFQLNRSFYPQVQNNKSIYPKFLLSAALASCSIYPAFSQDTFAEKQIETSRVKDKTQSNEPGPEYGKDSTKIIRGKVIYSETGEALPFVTISILESGKSIISDPKGNFELSVTDDFPDKFDLNFSILGFNPKKISFRKSDIPNFIKVELSDMDYILGESNILIEE